MTKKELNEIFNEMNNISISDLGEFINNLFEEKFEGKFKKFEKFINAFHNTPILEDETYYVALDTIRDIESYYLGF